MEEQCKSNDRPLLEDMRLVAGMMRMGERIAFGRDADLMERAAETIVGHQYEVENLESDKDSLRERIEKLEATLRNLVEAVKAGEAVSGAEAMGAAEAVLAN